MIETVSSNIKKIIFQQGMKQKAVANKAGFGEIEFCNMLNGRKVLKAEAIPRICEALGCQPNDLFNNEHQKGA